MTKILIVFSKKLIIFKNGAWSKDELVDCFNEVLDDFSHLEKGKNLDEKCDDRF